MKTVFVTGATGFIGRRLVHRLRDQGHSVKVLSRLSGDPELENRGVDWIQGDLLKPVTFLERLGKVDWVFHLAADTFSSKNADYFRNNVDATKLLIHTMEHLMTPPERFIFTSSIAAVDRASTDLARRPLDDTTPPQPATDYGRSKLDCEKAIEASTLPWTIIRPPFVGGPGMKPNALLRRLATACADGSFLSFFQWPGAFSVLHVDDLCDALIFAAENPKTLRQTYFAVGDTVLVADLLRQFRKALKKPAPPIPARWMRKGGELLLPVLPITVRALLFPAWTADGSRLRALGWTPKRPLSALIKQVVEQKAELRKSPPLRTG